MVCRPCTKKIKGFWGDIDMNENNRNIIHLIANEGFEDFIFDSDFDVEYDDREKIEDVANFKRELTRQNMLTPQLEEFIENYMRWDNK